MLEMHGSTHSSRSTRSSRLARQSQTCRVVSSRAKWNLGLYNKCLYKLFIAYTTLCTAIQAMITGYTSYDAHGKHVGYLNSTSMRHMSTRKFINFDYKMSTRKLYVCTKYSMFDPICDVITCCVRSCNRDQINVYDKIVSEN